MLLRERIKSLKKAIYGLKQSHGRGLRSSTLPSLALVFTGFNQITVFVLHIKFGIVILAVYIDDILLTGSDSAGLLETKEYLKRYFVTKDIERSKYFPVIEVAHQKHSILLSQ